MDNTKNIFNLENFVLINTNYMRWLKKHQMINSTLEILHQVLRKWFALSELSIVQLKHQWLGSEDSQIPSPLYFP